MIDRVTEYAHQVVNGNVKCGELHKLACKRHLEDLKKQNTTDFPYYWDITQSERILEYAETLTIGEGFEQKLITLLGSQIFDLGCPFRLA